MRRSARSTLRSSEERDDIVRIMTIHAAKGLEFPIVASANVEWEGRNQVPPVPDAVNHRVDFTVGNDWARSPRPTGKHAKQAEKEALEAERDRLLYVAVTRARDHLVVPGCTGGWRSEGVHGEDGGVGRASRIPSGGARTSAATGSTTRERWTACRNGSRRS